MRQIIQKHYRRLIAFRGSESWADVKKSANRCPTERHGLPRFPIAVSPVTSACLLALVTMSGWMVLPALLAARTLPIWSAAKGRVVARRVGFPHALGLRALPRAVAADSVADAYLPFGRHGQMPFHTFVDDWRLEQFWRRPQEGLIKALASGYAVAPDFTVFDDDPEEWAEYQVFRSAMIGQYWSSHGVAVLPVVAFRGRPERYVLPWSVWAVRGPSAGDEELWLDGVRRFVADSKPSSLVVFGRQVTQGLPSCPVIHRPLFSRSVLRLSSASALLYKKRDGDDR